MSNLLRSTNTTLFAMAFVILTNISFAAVPEQKAIIDYRWPFHPENSHHGMVVSADKLASQIGANILSEGGNAVDAGVAVGFALAVTMPKAGNLAGGGFMLIHLSKNNKNIALDYRETAPLDSTTDMFVNEDGTVNKSAIRYSAKGTAVPGTVAGLVYAQKKYGLLTLAQTMKPAIDLAENGFPVSWALASSLQARKKRLMRCEVSANAFFRPNGESFQAGELMKRPDLAKTLKLISNKGSEGFYGGAFAKKLVKGIKQHGGIISLQDLQQYQPIERKMLMGNYHGYQIGTMPPPSSGGVHLIQMLNILENYPLAQWGSNRAITIQVMVEAMRSAYADRSKYLGDPGFVDVPVKWLTNKKYAKQIASQITLGKARKSNDVQPGKAIPYESPQTTQFSVVDEKGNMVSNTYTLNFSYGNGHMIAGTGVLLNNEMDDFSAKAGVPNAYGLLGGKANSIKPGKRPLSSMTPTFVFKDGKPLLATGSPGGSTIITVVLETLVNVIDFKMNIAAATAWPRFHHQWYPDVVYVEPGISMDTRDALTHMGYNVRPRRTLGATQSVEVRGKYQFGASDSRRAGGGAVAVELSPTTIP